MRSLLPILCVATSLSMGCIFPNDLERSLETGSDANVGNDISGPCPAMCSGACAEIFRDPSNCGECGKECGAGEVCVEGQCSCADIGPIGGPSPQPCPSDAICSGYHPNPLDMETGAYCALERDIHTCDTSLRRRACSKPDNPLISDCVDILSDFKNCGGCNISCQSGKCKLGYCE